MAVRLHNALKITESISSKVRFKYARPYLTIDAERLVNAIRKTIKDPRLKRIEFVGSVDQYLDSTDVLDYPERATKLKVLYE